MGKKKVVKNDTIPNFSMFDTDFVGINLHRGLSEEGTLEYWLSLTIFLDDGEEREDNPLNLTLFTGMGSDEYEGMLEEAILNVSNIFGHVGGVVRLFDEDMEHEEDIDVNEFMESRRKKQSGGRKVGNATFH